MKTSILLSLILLFLSSITYRRTKDCGCAISGKYYYKGKEVKRFVTAKGVLQTPAYVDNTIEGENIKYDSVSFTPTN